MGCIPGLGNGSESAAGSAEDAMLRTADRKISLECNAASTDGWIVAKLKKCGCWRRI